MILIEHNGIIYGNMEERDFNNSKRWASTTYDPDDNPISLAKEISDREGTPVIEILEDWADSQVDKDIANLEEEFDYYYQGE